MNMLTRTSEQYAAFAGDRNDCVVRAMSLVANVPYAEVAALALKHGRKPGKGTSHATQAAMARDLGMAQVLDCYWGRFRSLRPTLASFMRSNPFGHFYVVRRGHAFVVIDGVVHDWSASDTGARSRVILAYEVKA